jgi:hypothetical protein
MKIAKPETRASDMNCPVKVLKSTLETTNSLNSVTEYPEKPKPFTAQNQYPEVQTAKIKLKQAINPNFFKPIPGMNQLFDTFTTLS